MTEAGWLGGWLPRVLQPFASASPGKRKTPCLPVSTEDACSRLVDCSGEFPKRQKLGILTPAGGQQPLQAASQLAHYTPQKHSQQALQREQLLQQKRQKRHGVHTQQPSFCRIGRSRLLAGRLQGPCGGDSSDASFASVPSEDEAFRLHAHLHPERHARRAGQAWMVPRSQPAAGASRADPRYQEQAQQPHLQQQQSLRVPPLPLKPSQHKQQQKASSSLFPPSSLIHAVPTDSSRMVVLDFSSAPAATAAQMPPAKVAATAASPRAAGKARQLSSSSTRTLSDSVGASSSVLPRSLSLAHVPAAVSGNSASFCASAAAAAPLPISASASALPSLPVFPAPTSAKSLSTSALPPLSCGLDGGGPGACATVAQSRKRICKDETQHQMLPLQQRRLAQQQQQEPYAEQPFGVPSARGGESLFYEKENDASRGQRCVTKELPASLEQHVPPFLAHALTVVGPFAKLQKSHTLEAVALGLSTRQRRAACGDGLSGQGRKDAVFDEPKEPVFASPQKEEMAPSLGDGGGVLFGHRVLRPLLSKDPSDNYDAFLDILKHAQKHCDAEALDFLLSDQELQYYTRGSCHPSITLFAQQRQDQQQQQHLQHPPRHLQKLAGARPSWALPAALLTALDAQRDVDPFSVFGEAPPELMLHEVYGQEHYNATSRSVRATHPVLARLDKQRLLSPPASSSTQQQHGATGAAGVEGKEKGALLSAERWESVVLPALLNWWQRDSAVELDWRHDPLTAEDCAWYLQAIGATRDLTHLVTLKQPCFCPTPPPQRGWSWTDSRQLLRRRLGTTTSTLSQTAGEGLFSASPSLSPPKPHARDRLNKSRWKVPLQPQRTSAITARGRALGAAAALSPITPGVRRQRQRKWAEASAARTGRSRSRKKSRFFSPEGSPAAEPSPALHMPAKAAASLSSENTMRCATTEPPSSVPHGPREPSADLGRLLADAQRRLDKLAERMRCRSRPPLNAPLVSSAQADMTQQRSSPSSNTVSSSAPHYRTAKSSSSARTMSASGSFSRAHLQPSFGRGPTSSTSRLDLLSAASRGRAVAAAGAPLPTGGKSFYSSSNLPLPGREKGTLFSSSSAVTARAPQGEVSLIRPDAPIGYSAKRTGLLPAASGVRYQAAYHLRSAVGKTAPRCTRILIYSFSPIYHKTRLSNADTPTQRQSRGTKSHSAALPRGHEKESLSLKLVKAPRLSVQRALSAREPVAKIFPAQRQRQKLPAVCCYTSASASGGRSVPQILEGFVRACGTPHDSKYISRMKPRSLNSI
ncbi:hypothetical protein ACSSS7_002328 [Eimeria intestinalis]